MLGRSFPFESSLLPNTFAPEATSRSGGITLCVFASGFFFFPPVVVPASRHAGHQATWSRRSRFVSPFMNIIYQCLAFLRPYWRKVPLFCCRARSAGHLRCTFFASYRRRPRRALTLASSSSSSPASFPSDTSRP